MIRVILPNITLGLVFRHSKTSVMVPGTNPVEFRDTMGTYCEVYEIHERKVIINGEDVIEVSQRWVCEGSAIVHPKDKFIKRDGRKIALTKALKQLKPAKYGESIAVSAITLGRKERELVWEAYNKFVEAPTQPSLRDIVNIIEAEEATTGISISHATDAEIYAYDRIKELLKTCGLVRKIKIEEK